MSDRVKWLSEVEKLSASRRRLLGAAKRRGFTGFGARKIGAFFASLEAGVGSNFVEFSRFGAWNGEFFNSSNGATLASIILIL
jgi:hypothetical protein